MQLTWLDQINAWNPQLVREWRGRLKARSIIAAIALSLIWQLLLFLALLRANFLTGDIRDEWRDIWRAMSWGFPYLLFSLGGYYIVSDITQEEKRGTLNFVRLSPRPGWQILLGKLLGVPILPYIAVIAAIPFHLIAAIYGQVSPLLVLSFYIVLVVGCAFTYSLALLFGLVGSTAPNALNRQATTSVTFGILAFFFLSPMFMTWNITVTWQGLSNIENFARDLVVEVYWGFIAITANPLLSHGFTLINLLIATGLIWRIVLRRFRQPRSTLMSKRQSYATVAYAELLAIGFALNPEFGIPQSSVVIAEAIALYTGTIVLILIMMFATVPSRQALLDWSRYQSRGVMSWIWSDKSPMLLTLVINVGLASVLLIPWMFLSGIITQNRIAALISFVSVVMTLLIAGLFTQIVFAKRVRNPLTWAVGSLVIWLSVPAAIMSLLQLLPDRIGVMATFWTLFGYPVWHFDNPLALAFTLIGMVLQVLLIGMLALQLYQTLQQLHQS
ncbi:MAG: hypothetical protein VKL39_17635 [Leptolyngbyaceae bacterium]|nr:hypothetical protein [Leptolyngbyaceae bacterium]